MTLKLNGTNSVAAPAYAGDDADTGLQCGTNELKLVTGGTARATIDDSGRLMLGTTTEGEHTADDLTVATSGDTGISIRSGTSSSGKLFFSDGTSSADEYRGFIQYSHSNNAMSFGTDSTERMRILSGGGLTFNGDTAATNALNDYEEGDWTPSMHSGGWTGFSIQSAKYVKIGALVFVQCYVSSLTGSGTTNVLELASLPFNSISNGYTAGSVDFGEGSVKGVYARTESNSNKISFFYPSESNSTSRVSLKGNQIGDAYIIIGLTYFTNS